MPEGSCIIGRGHLKRSGYRNVWKDGRTWREHRVVWAATYGPIPAGLLVCHHCDNRQCINLDHLFLGTCRDNLADAARKGRMRGPRGEKNWRNKLTVDQVRQIKHMSGTQKEIAKLFGVDQGQISRIKNNKQWRWL